MKKYIKLLLMVCIFGVLLCGCGKGEKDKNENKEATALTIYEQLKIQKTPLSDTDSEIVQTGVNEWVKAFLAVNSDAKDKEITDDDLYQNIANEEQKNKLKKERDAFYKDSTVTIGEVSTEIKDSKKAKYNEREVGVVDCKTTVKGTRNNEAFEQTYTMQMVVDYQTDVVSVYEVSNITWK